MPKKKLRFIQALISLIPTALIVLGIFWYGNKQKQLREEESKNYLEIPGIYFGYLETIRRGPIDVGDSLADNEPLLFQLQVKKDESGTYFTLYDSPEKFYFNRGSRYEFNTRNDTVDEFTLFQEKLTISISQNIDANTIYWSNRQIVWDIFLKRKIHETEYKGTLTKRSEQIEVFPLN